MGRKAAAEREMAMTPRQLRKWLVQHELSYTTGAEALGLSRRQFAHYIIGTKPIPKFVWLATVGYTARQDHGRG